MKQLVKLVTALLALILLALPLASCSESSGKLSDTITVSGLTVELYEKDGVIVGLTVKDGERIRARLKCNGLAPSAVDMNFDGHDDLRLESVEDQGQFECFLYQPSINSLSPSADLGALIDPVWNYETRTVDSRIYKIEYYSEKPGEISGYRETRGKASWHFVGGILTQINESGIYHDSDGELYCVYEAKTVGGELVYDYGAEKWYYLDELIAAGYEW